MKHGIASSVFAVVLGVVLSMTGASVLAALPLNPDNPGLSDAQRHAEIRKKADFWAEVDALVDRSQTQPNHLGRDLGTIDAAFEWVRDHTRPVPYRGVLRGANGVLQDRQGNSLDRSLLLAALLTAQGHDTRLVRGTLAEPDHLQALEQTWQVPFDPHETQVLSLDRSIEHAMAEHGFEEAPDAQVANFLTEAQQLEDHWQSLQVDLGRLLAGLVGDELDLRQPVIPAPDSENWRDHWWVEVDNEGDWKSLDPALPDAVPGATLTDGEQRLSIDELPDDMHHALDISVVATVSEGDELTEHVLVETTVYPYQLNTPMVSITMAPLSGSVVDLFHEARGSLSPDASLIDQFMGIEEWLPVITVDEYTIVEKSIFSDGRIREDANEAPVGRAFRSAAGALGGLSISGLSRSEPERRWEALHVDLVRHRPGQQPDTFRQTRFDRLDDSWRRPVMAAYGLSDEDLLVFGAIAHESRFYLDFFSPSPHWYLDQMLSAFLGNEELVVAALTDPGFTFTGDMLGALPLIPNGIFEFLTLRSADEAFTRQSAADRIGLLAIHEGRLPRDRQTLRGYQTIDVISHQRALRVPSSPGLSPGLLMSVLEWRALDGADNVESAAQQLLDSADANQWVLLKSSGDWRLVPGSANEPAPWAFDRIWDRQHWVLAERAEDGSAYPLATQWWEIDPQSGDVLARDLFGHGGATLTWFAPALQMPLIAASPAAEWIFWTSLVSAAMFGSWGFHGCIEKNQNDACCFVQLGGGMVAGFGLGLLMGKLTALSAVKAFWVGVGFDAASAVPDLCHLGGS